MKVRRCFDTLMIGMTCLVILYTGWAVSIRHQFGTRTVRQTDTRTSISHGLSDTRTLLVKNRDIQNHGDGTATEYYDWDSKVFTTQPKEANKRVDTKPSSFWEIQRDTRFVVSNETKDVKYVESNETRHLDRHELLTKAIDYASVSDSYPPTIVKGVNINGNISSFSHLRKDIGDVYVNNHHYYYSLKSDICNKKDLFLIMVIHSAPAYFKKRSLIRKTYGSVSSYQGKNMGVVFMIGQTNDELVQKNLLQESTLHGDIVQGNFPDYYRSLSKKHIMAMHWYNHYCNSTTYILKLDDDTFVNIYKFMDYILKNRPKGKTLHCRVSPPGELLARDPESKWYTPMAQYPFHALPVYCRGFAYLTTPETWRAMYSASETTRSLDMDDVYVTGLLGMRISVQHVNIEQHLYNCTKRKNVVNVYNLNNRMLVWDPRNHCGTVPFQVWRQIRP